VQDLGYGDLGFTGHPTTHTPALDRLASTGKRLTQWYSGYAVCTSSRTALLTGRQPSRVGMPGVINSLSAAGLPLSEVTLADHLHKAGYKSLALGK
jgi:arylsulfatase A